MRSGTLQVHPSARCNLRCHHCYSSSGPDRTDALELDLLTAAVDDAADLGYATLAVSGGEPLLYRHLEGLLRHARAAGMRTQVTTNGTLATPARLGPLAPLLDVVAFSLDGPPDLHNAVRAAPWAFDRLVTGLETATALGIPHGVLFTATVSSWPYVDWAAQFARHHRCALFQVHAVEAAGRACDEMDGELADQDVLDFAFVAASMARERYGDDMAVHLDLIHRSQLEAMCVRGPGAGQERRPSMLVVEEDGVVVPHTHGFNRAAAVADLHTERLGDAFGAFASDVYPGLVDLAEDTRARLLASGRTVVDWYAELSAAGRTSLTGAAPVAVHLRT